MGTRQLAYITFRQDFLFEDESTYHEFADTVLNHITKIVAFQERKFSDRGIECLKNDDPVEFGTTFEDDDD